MVPQADGQVVYLHHGAMIQGHTHGTYGVVQHPQAPRYGMYPQIQCQGGLYPQIPTQGVPYTEMVTRGQSGNPVAQEVGFTEGQDPYQQAKQDQEQGGGQSQACGQPGTSTQRSTPLTTHPSTHMYPTQGAGQGHYPQQMFVVSEHTVTHK